MKTLIWAAGAGVVGLVWITLESILGMHDDGTSYAPNLLWLIVPPLCAIGAMVHLRLTADSITYGQSAKTGIMTGVYAGGILLVVWVFVTQLLAPEYLDMMIRSVARQSSDLGETQAMTAQRIKMARVIFTVPTFYILGLLLPAVTSAIASFMAALALQKAEAKKDDRFTSV